MFNETLCASIAQFFTDILCLRLRNPKFIIYYSLAGKHDLRQIYFNIANLKASLFINILSEGDINQ